MAAAGLSQSLLALGFELQRFKTGTPPRLNGRTIDFDRLERQPGDEKPVPFSFLTDAIDAIGIQICVYYGLAGLTVVIAFRKVLFASVKNFLLIGLWPFVGAVFMFWLLGESIPSDGAVVVWFGVGGLAIGFIPLAIYWVKGSPYFKQRPTLGSVLPEDAGV